MAKILELSTDKTKIRLDDGSIIEVDTDSLDFIPTVGDEVDVFMSYEEIIVNLPDDQSTDKNFNHSNYTDEYIEDYYYGRRVHKIAYILLALFLGSFGGHKFYSGQIVRGFLYILFSWTFIPTLLAIIAIIQALLKSPDEFGYIYV